MAGLQDALFFVDLAHECVSYRPSIASELGGLVYILSEMGKAIYSYDIKGKTISLSCMPCLEPTRRVSLWKLRLPGDEEEINRQIGFEPKDDREEDETMIRSVSEIEIDSPRDERLEENIASPFFNIQLDVLKTIAEFFVGVEYLNFRATCKYCRLAAPMIQWSNERMRTYSVPSPWLVVLDKDHGFFIFTDLMFGDKYFKKKPEKIPDDLGICCSRYGWLLIKKNNSGEYSFFNPFANDIRRLPRTHNLDSVCFSEPPTSPDCLVVGFSVSNEWNVYIYSANGGPMWHRFHINFGTSPHYLSSPTFYGRDIYVLDEGVLHVFKESMDGFHNRHNAVVEVPRGFCSGSSAQYFPAKCGKDLLMFLVDDFGESVEVFKLKHYTNEWKKIDGLGKYMIYICGKTCLCLEAKTAEMENKIYFPRFDSKKSKIVFYSLETCRYHTFNGRDIGESFGDFFGSKYHLYPHAWIEPNWS